MLQIKLKSCSYLISLLIIFFYSPLFSEEKIDIWKNKKEGTTINLIFKNKGEKYFRKIENDISLIELKKANSVISLGGGAFLNNTIRKATKKFSISFWLDVSIDELIKRLKKSNNRPLLLKKNISETVKKIYFERKKIYNESNYRIKCNSLKAGDIAKKVLSIYEKSGN